MEIINKQLKPAHITHALFDFDGTISSIREGWQKIMVPMMVDELMETPRHEERSDVERIVKGYVDELTGKQTMYQMLRFVEEIEERGGKAKTALEYKHRYLDLLNEHISERLHELELGKVSPERHMIAGSRPFLELLQKKGISCYLASGTDEQFVIREAQLLGVADFFKALWGAKDEHLSFSKKIAIERILDQQNLSGDNLVVFGDGYVEIQEAKAHGAIAVGIASDEQTRSEIDPAKRERLIRAGADVIVGDFTNAEDLTGFLWSNTL